MERNKDTEHSETTRHIRGSSLLLIGRLFSLLTNFSVQILTVRYLVKSDYGAFTYALSVVAMGTSLIPLGLNRSVARFVPIYQEQLDYRSMFGTIMLALGTVVGFGLALVLMIFGLQGFLTDSVVSDPLSVGLLLILIALSPIQALDNLFQSLFAVFASPRSIFFRRYVLGPCLKLAAVLLVVLTQGSVHYLAVYYLIAGILGMSIYILMLYQLLYKQGLWQKLNLKDMQFPIRKIFGHSIPLLSSDVYLILKTSIAILLLEFFRGTIEVADFRAVVPIAGLNLIVVQSLKLLYTPLASRLYIRDDGDGINELFWQSAIWVTMVTFPVFAVCFFLAEPVTVLICSSRYAGAGVILAILSIGNYFNALLGLNSYTLQVYAKVGFITCINGISVMIGLGLNLWLIPGYGAKGAAIATTATLVIHNLLNHVGLLSSTQINLLQWRYLKVYLHVLLAIIGLWLVQWKWTPSVFSMIVLIVLVSLFLLRLNRNSMNIAKTFPELSRIYLLRKLLGMERHP